MDNCPNREALRPFFASQMTAEQYAELAIAFTDDKGSEMNNLLHAALGIAGEAGETVDIIKKSWAYGKPLNREELIKEVGDQLWYINLLIDTLGVTWGEVFAANVAKLTARYPEKKFSADRAINRG